MKLEIVSDDREHAILVGDEHHNDIAEFFHSDHATVSQSYETALMLARKLVEAAKPHKIMTPEEYAAMPLKGWHEVCRDVDGFGGVGVRFLGV